MKPIPFEDANCTIGGEVPANRRYGVILTRWKGNWRERLKFLWYGTLWLSVIGDTMPPTLITSDQIFEIEHPPELVKVADG